MTRTRMGRIARLCSLLVLLLVTATGARPVGAAARAPDFAAIDAYVRAQMAAAPIPGLALGIVQGDRIVHLQGFGVAGPDGRPVTPQTPFNICSVSKTLTGLAIRQLINRGQVAAETPVQRYLPWFRVADPQASAQITIRDLLHHRSGLSRNAGITIAFDDRYTLEQRVRRLDQVALNGPVGGRYEYSDANFLVLGLVVETVSGQPYATYLQEHILAPLEMHNTFTALPAAQQAGLARGYQPWFGVVLPTAAPYVPGMLPAGYVLSSAEDMARYASLYFTGGSYAGRSLVGTAPGRTETNYDLEWNPGEAIPRGYIGQEGAGANYSGGLYLSPEQDWGVVVLSNARLDLVVPGPQGGNIAEGVMRLLRGEQPAPPSDHGFGQSYLLLDAFGLLIGAFLVVQALRLPRWRAPVPQKAGPILRRIILPLALDLALAVLFLGALPLLDGLPWAYLWVVQPDVTATLIAAGVLLLGLAVVKAVLAALAWGRPVPQGASMLPGAPEPPAPRTA